MKEFGLRLKNLDKRGNTNDNIFVVTKYYTINDVFINLLWC